MRPRQDITEIFSTFLQFDADRCRDWATDPRLRRSMQGCLKQLPQPELSENFWALYWHKLWQTDRLAFEHLVAYVQEPCYWAAQKTVAGFANVHYTLGDCFQMAIARIDRVFKGFNPSLGSFKNYASIIFASLIRESLRQRQEVDICTDWALLRKLSQKRLVESLQNAGLTSETDRYILAWNCFKLLYLPTQASGTRKLPKPDRATWEAIAHHYNTERNLITPTEAIATPETLEKWLLACAKAARAYLYPTLVSINAPKPGQDGGEFLDDLPETVQTSLLSELIAEEEAGTRRNQQAQLNSMLDAALSQLDVQAIAILQMYYCQGLTQQQMAAQLNTKQYTVSRRLTKARETLLLALAKWSQETLHITPTPDVLKDTSLALEEWLKTHYSHPDLPTPEMTPVE